MARQAQIMRIARRYWRLAGIPELTRGRTGLLDAFDATTWPLDTIDKVAVQEIGDVVVVLPFALAEEAMRNGMSTREVLHVFADALDPRA
jgi:hypothetical protein